MRRLVIHDSRQLPNADSVWLRVAEYARDRHRTRRPVFTVSQRVENYITDVGERSIGRVSARGTTNSSRVTRGMVANVWSDVHGKGSGSGYLYFAKVLVLAALAGTVEDMDGK